MLSEQLHLDTFKHSKVHTITILKFTQLIPLAGPYILSWFCHPCTLAHAWQGKDITKKGILQKVWHFSLLGRLLPIFTKWRKPYESEQDPSMPPSSNITFFKDVPNNFDFLIDGIFRHLKTFLRSGNIPMINLCHNRLRWHTMLVYLFTSSFVIRYFYYCNGNTIP